MYKKIYEQGKGENKHLIHLWDVVGYRQINWNNYAYRECREEDAKYKGLKGEHLIRTHNWDRNTHGLHFADISAHQKFLIEEYNQNSDGKEEIDKFVVVNNSYKSYLYLKN
jgi:hypothetical protein